MTNRTSQVGGEGQSSWGGRFVTFLLFGIGIGFGVPSIWVYEQYKSLFSGENISLSELPLPSLFIPEFDPQTGDYKTKEPNYNVADRVLWRLLQARGFGLILLVGGYVALVIPRHRADYRISTAAIFCYVALVACCMVASFLVMPLVAATLGIVIWGRRAFWPSFGVGLASEALAMAEIASLVS
ncbi:MAG: hypothetical protein KDB14_17025 [Planctomycetales bacterium]|nr:hypothetical protein [Planctomycetales bacterium]